MGGGAFDTVCLPLVCKWGGGNCPSDPPRLRRLCMKAIYVSAKSSHQQFQKFLLETFTDPA